MNSYELDLQNLNCIKEINHIGSTTYVDICNATETIVEWGGLGWLSFIAISVFGLLLISLLTYGVYELSRS